MVAGLFPSSNRKHTRSIHYVAGPFLFRARKNYMASVGYAFFGKRSPPGHLDLLALKTLDSMGPNARLRNGLVRPTGFRGPAAVEPGNALSRPVAPQTTQRGIHGNRFPMVSF